MYSSNSGTTFTSIASFPGNFDMDGISEQVLTMKSLELANGYFAVSRVVNDSNVGDDYYFYDVYNVSNPSTLLFSLDYGTFSTISSVISNPSHTWIAYAGKNINVSTGVSQDPGGALSCQSNSFTKPLDFISNSPKYILQCNRGGGVVNFYRIDPQTNTSLILYAGTLGTTPALSPDGTSLALTQSNSIRVLPTDGSKTPTLFCNNESCSSPAWTKDSSRIVFLKRQNGVQKLNSISYGGTNEATLSKLVLTSQSVSNFYISPYKDEFTDEYRVIYQATQNDSFYTQLYSNNIMGTDLHDLNPSLKTSSYLGMTGDGQKVVFLEYPMATSTPRSLVMTNNDGSGRVVLIENTTTNFISTDFYSHKNWKKNFVLGRYYFIGQ